MKLKYTDARSQAEKRLSAKELENSHTLDPKLRFIPKHPLEPALRSILVALIAALEEGGVPEGFRAPIATGPTRKPISRRTAETLLCNLLHLQKGKRHTLALPLQHASYQHTDLSGTGLVNLVKLGDCKDLWKVFQGFRTQKTSRLSRLYPRRKFHQIVEAALAEGTGNEDLFYAQPERLVQLRDERGESIPERHWRTNAEQETQLQLLTSCIRWFNLVLSEYQIRTTGRLLYPVLYAVFNRDFAHGGRLYTGHGGHTNLPKAERSAITFNGHPTVELDFQGFHLRMLYDLIGVPFAYRSDPYAAVLKTLGLRAEAIFKDFPAVRDDLKNMLLAFINDTATEKQQIARSNRRLFYGSTKETQEDAKLCEERWSRAGLLKFDKAGKPTSAHVLAAFRKAHRPIAQKFATGCGLRLQNLDAEITRWVLLEMMVSGADECIPTLPVHDSFITFAEYQGKLEEAMQDAYCFVLRKQTKRNFPFKIPINKG